MSIPLTLSLNESNMLMGSLRSGFRTRDTIGLRSYCLACNSNFGCQTKEDRGRTGRPGTGTPGWLECTGVTGVYRGTHVGEKSGGVRHD